MFSVLDLKILKRKIRRGKNAFVFIFPDFRKWFFLLFLLHQTPFSPAKASLLITVHQLISLMPSSFILTRSPLVPNSIDLWGSILKREFLWGSKCRSPHYKTKHLTTKPIYSKQTTDYKLQWSSITSPLSHAMLGQTPLTHYSELQQRLCPNCNECSRNNYLYAC